MIAYSRPVGVTNVRWRGDQIVDTAVIDMDTYRHNSHHAQSNTFEHDITSVRRPCRSRLIIYIVKAEGH